jgi:hypothetical protein
MAGQELPAHLADQALLMLAAVVAQDKVDMVLVVLVVAVMRLHQEHQVLVLLAQLIRAAVLVALEIRLAFLAAPALSLLNLFNVKKYQLYGIDSAMQLLRPNAKWEISNRTITLWEDDRPCPTWEEIDTTMEKIKAFEDSIPTIWTTKILEEMEM